MAKLGTKRGVDRGSSVASLVGGIDFFYETVVQNLRPWATRAPRLPKETSLSAAGIDVTPESDSIDTDTVGPDGSIGAPDRLVRRDVDAADLDEDVTISDEELADWLRQETDELPDVVADHTEQATPDLPTLAAPDNWAPPAAASRDGWLPPPPAVSARAELPPPVPPSDISPQT